MGCGSWTTDAFTAYSTCIGRKVDTSTGTLSGSYSSQEIYKQSGLHKNLNPRNVMRECRDNEEHPNTIPVILALDVTGSMGEAAVQVAKNINAVMTRLYAEVKDIEFMIMGIGDLAYDSAPIQISQFESDIRIAEQLDQVYFEYGGGGNYYESYTAAWYMGLNHTDLDCWKRDKRGIIITLGDERLNPYLPANKLRACTDDKVQGDVETDNLYKEVSKKFDIYHIDVDHRSYRRDSEIDSSWKMYLDEDHYRSVKLDAVTDTIIEMILKSVGEDTSVESNISSTDIQTNENGEIVW